MQKVSDSRAVPVVLVPTWKGSPSGSGFARNDMLALRSNKIEYSPKTARSGKIMNYTRSFVKRFISPSMTK